MKQLAKAIIAQTPYRIVRDRGANRFQAIDTSLRGLLDRGFDTRLVIDGGAHLGQFSLAARKIFRSAEFHLVEPQVSCQDHLGRLCEKEGFILHKCALSDSNGEIGFMPSSTPATGAYVDENSSYSVPAFTLDTLFSDNLAKANRPLLKMDLQGYEMHALRGASAILPSIEVILTEVSFFAQAYEPSVVDLLSFLDKNGFVLYDIASISGRTRDNRMMQGDLVFIRKDSGLGQDCGWQ